MNNQELDQALELLQREPAAWLSFSEATRTQIKKRAKPIYMAGCMVPFDLGYNTGLILGSNNGQ